MSTTVSVLVEVGHVILDARHLLAGQPIDIALDDNTLTLQSQSQYWRVLVINRGGQDSSDVDVQVSYGDDSGAGDIRERYIVKPRGKSRFGSSVVIEGEVGDSARLSVASVSR